MIEVGLDLPEVELDTDKGIAVGEREVCDCGLIVM